MFGEDALDEAFLAIGASYVHGTSRLSTNNANIDSLIASLDGTTKYSKTIRCRQLAIYWNEDAYFVF